MKTFQQYLNEKENLDEGVKDYIKAGLTAAAMALSNQGTQAQQSQQPENPRIEALKDHAKKNKIYLSQYIEDILSTGENLFKNKKYIDGYDVTIFTHSGNQKAASFGRGVTFEPKKDDPNTYAMRMDFVVEIHGDNVKKLKKEEAVTIARKAVQELNNTNQTILGNFAFKPKFSTEGTESWNKPDLTFNNQKNKLRLSVAAFGEIPNPYLK
jgi:hypothetical protein